MDNVLVMSVHMLYLQLFSFAPVIFRETKVLLNYKMWKDYCIIMT